MSVNLHPEIEESCRDFLHTTCLSHTQPGEELGCLQEHFNVLDGECKQTVEQYTKIEARNPYLHPVISRACSNLIDRKCGAESKAQDGTGVMECLVRHKLEHPQGSKGSMNQKVNGQFSLYFTRRYCVSVSDCCGTMANTHYAKLEV